MKTNGQLYHGTACGSLAQFTAQHFHSGNLGKGVYVTDNLQAAGYYSMLAGEGEDLRSHRHPDVVDYPHPERGIRFVYEVEVLAVAGIVKLDRMPSLTEVDKIRASGATGINYPDHTFKHTEDWAENLGEFPKNPRAVLVFNPEHVSVKRQVFAAVPPLAPDAYLGSTAYRDALRVPYFAGDTVIASSRTTPSSYKAPAAGFWRVDAYSGIHGHEVYQLRWLPVSAIRMTEEDWADGGYENYGGKRDDAFRYAEWLNAGHKSPPVDVAETEKGTLQLCHDGHRRLAAHKLAKLDYILAWVSPCMDHPEGLRMNGDGPIMRVGMTYEGVHGVPFANAKIEVALVDDLPVAAESVKNAVK